TIDLTAPAPPPAVAAPPVGEPATAPPVLRGPSRLRGILAGASYAALGFAGLFAIWSALSAWKPAIPSPGVTFQQFRELLADPFRDGAGNDKGIFIQLRGSLGRVARGFGLAALVGIPFGLLIGAWKPAWRAANPVIQLLRPVSPLAWYPIWLTVFAGGGGGAVAPAAVWTIFITALWPVVINTAAGAASVPVDQRNVSQVFRFGRLAYLRHVLVPHTLPSIVTGLRLSMGIAWMVIVAVEMLSGGVGIGFFVWDSYNAFNLAKVISAIAIIGAVGLVLDAAFLRLGRAVQHEGAVAS
ncbi:MAG TPA: nitrate ABC transporter permease, partial [Acidimicrobiales bacterium]|nr:nitrate ABC transporter permease [Acidimicrobiales bacterium]